MDRILAFGALHNAPYLDAAFKEMARALTPTGWLVCSDLALRPGTPTSQQEDLSLRVIPQSGQRFGTDGIRYRDTSDFFRTVANYVVAAQEADLVVYTIVFDHRQRHLWRRPSLRASLRDFGLTTHYPWRARDRYDRLLMLCTREAPSENLDPIGEIEIGILHRTIYRVISPRRIFRGARRRFRRIGTPKP